MVISGECRHDVSQQVSNDNMHDSDNENYSEGFSLSPSLSPTHPFSLFLSTYTFSKQI